MCKPPKIALRRTNFAKKIGERIGHEVRLFVNFYEQSSNFLRKVCEQFYSLDLTMFFLDYGIASLKPFSSITH